jgi:hypothetical protein
MNVIQYMELIEGLENLSNTNCDQDIQSESKRIFSLLDFPHESQPEKRSCNRERNRTEPLDRIKNLSEKEFTRFMRVSRNIFYSLLEKITPLIDPSKKGQQNAMNSSGSGISNELKLAATLRYLAGGSYLDITFEFGLGQNSFFHSKGPLWPTMIALYKVLQDEISFPIQDKNELANIEKGFANCSKNANLSPRSLTQLLMF